MKESPTNPTSSQNQHIITNYNGDLFQKTKGKNSVFTKHLIKIFKKASAHDAFPEFRRKMEHSIRQIR